MICQRELPVRRLLEARSDVLRASIQTAVVPGDDDETVVPIERDGIVIDGVDDDESRRRGFARVNGLAKSLGEQ